MWLHIAKSSFVILSVQYWVVANCCRNLEDDYFIFWPQPTAVLKTFFLLPVYSHCDKIFFQNIWDTNFTNEMDISSSLDFIYSDIGIHLFLKFWPRAILSGVKNLFYNIWVFYLKSHFFTWVQIFFMRFLFLSKKTPRHLI